MINIGATIPQEISEFLREFTHKDEWGDVANIVNCSPSTVRDVLYRRNSVSEKSLEALKYLFPIATKNADQKIKSARNCKKAVKEILDCV